MKFISVMREVGSEPVCFYCPDSSQKKTCLKEITGALQQIKRLGLQSSERQRFNTDQSIWNCVKDSSQDIYYFLLTANSYPERHAYALLAKVEEALHNLEDLSDDALVKDKFDSNASELY